MCYTTGYLHRYPSGISHSILGTTDKEEKKKIEPTHLNRRRMISQKKEEERMTGARKKSTLAR